MRILFSMAPPFHFFILGTFSFLLVVQSSSCVRLCDPMDFCTPSFPVLHYLLEFAQTHVHRVIDAIQPSHPLLPPPAINLSHPQGLYNESALDVSWPKYWSFSINPSNEYLEFISFRIDRLDLAVQGTLKNLLQHYSLKASILWLSDFFMVHLSHLSMTMENHSLDYMDLCRRSGISAF